MSKVHVATTKWSHWLHSWHHWLDVFHMVPVGDHVHDWHHLFHAVAL